LIGYVINIFAVNTHGIIGNFKALDFLKEDFKMKFDVIVGNPPYQNEKSKSDAGKLYAVIAQKCFELLSQRGIMVFITPTTIVQEKKTGITLKSLQGLKDVNYKTNNFFPNIGIEVISWTLDKQYIGDVKVIEDDGIYLRKFGEPLVKNKDLLGFNLFMKIKNNKNKLFSIDQSTSKAKKQLLKTDEFCYEIYTNYFKNKIEYSKVKPKLYDKQKLAISLGKAYNIENCVLTKEDFGEYHCVADVDEYNEIHIDNLKSFLFNDISIAICKKYRELFKTGFNAILYSFPKIDKDKSYTEQDVIELFGLSDEEVQWLKMN